MKTRSQRAMDLAFMAMENAYFQGRSDFSMNDFKIYLIDQVMEGRVDTISTDLDAMIELLTGFIVRK